MSCVISVYKDVVSRYSDMVHDTSIREGATAGASATQTLSLAAAPRVRVQIRLQLELASPITVVLDSLYALTVCALIRWS